MEFMQKRNGFSTSALTVSADQLADTKSLVRSIMLKNMDGNNHLYELFVYLSNKVKSLWTNGVINFYGPFPTGSIDLCCDLKKIFLENGTNL